MAAASQGSEPKYPELSQLHTRRLVLDAEGTPSNGIYHGSRLCAVHEPSKAIAPTMTDQSTFHDFDSSPRSYAPDDGVPDFEQPTLTTLYSAFPQRDRIVSPTPIPASRMVIDSNHKVVAVDQHAPVDLWSLEYNSEYDTHLMCPICHIPFIDPVVLECDHTFCASCFDEHAAGTINTQSRQSQCPTCRTTVRATPKKASRLVSNMCNDIKVQCPNETCTATVARGSIETHVEKDCLEQCLSCPDPDCDKPAKRKNYIPLQCIHKTQTECDCGAVIKLGRGEWLKHKDEICPLTIMPCDHCGESVAANKKDNASEHQCLATEVRPKCPGEEYGCQGVLALESAEAHATLCPIARLTPYLNKQSRLVSTLSDQVLSVRTRNNVLEAGLDRIDELLSTQVQPRLHRLQSIPSYTEQDVEEIERDHIPSGAAVHHRDLLLPAHIRDLTPSPTMSHINAHQSPHSTSSHHHLLSLHESLRQNVSGIENEVAQLNNNLAELDARTSMQLMNETLRLKEELAHINAAVFSTRAQVQWLLNRERMNMGMLRGRMPGMAPQRQSGQAQTQSGNAQSTTPPASAGESSQFPLFPTSSAQSSTSTSPVFGAATIGNESRRPTLRRTSGGSQERVKL